VGQPYDCTGYLDFSASHPDPRGDHAAAVSLQYIVYNLIRQHRMLRTSPAMAAGVVSKLWEVSDLVALLEAAESKKRRRGRL